jgi:hypothetical protein
MIVACKLQEKCFGKDFSWILAMDPIEMLVADHFNEVNYGSRTNSIRHNQC